MVLCCLSQFLGAREKACTVVFQLCRAHTTELNNNCACVRLVNEQSETSVQNKYGGAFVGSFDSVFSLWKGSCAVNNFRGKLSCFEFGFCIECEDEVHADDSECPSER